MGDAEVRGRRGDMLLMIADEVRDPNTNRRSRPPQSMSVASLKGGVS